MKTWKKALVVIVFGFFGISILSTTTNVFAQEVGSESFPNWFRNVAAWWSNDEISDSDFVISAEFLINEGLTSITISEPKSSVGSIPQWVKNNAGW